MAYEFWTDQPATITISNKKAINSGIPSIDVTGMNGIICGSAITSTTTSVNRNVSNNAARNTSASVSASFYISCENDDTVAVEDTGDEGDEGYGNVPGSGTATGDIKVKLWWDALKKNDTSDDTYVEQTLSEVTVYNAVEQVRITGIRAEGTGEEIEVGTDSNGVKYVYTYNATNGIIFDYALYGEQHGTTYLPIFSDQISVKVDNETSNNYTSESISVGDGIIYGQCTFMPDGTTSGSTSTEETLLATALFNTGLHTIRITALGSYTHPTTSIQLRTYGEEYIEIALSVTSFTFSDTTATTSGSPTITFDNNLTLDDVEVEYSCDDYDIDPETGTFEDFSDAFEDSIFRSEMTVVTAHCTYGTQTVDVNVTAYWAASIVNYLKFSAPSTAALQLVNNGSNSPNVYYSTSGTNFNKMSASTDYSFTTLYVYGYNTSGFSSSTSKYSTFSITNGSNVSCTGDAMGLLNGTTKVTTIPCNYCFYNLFSGNTSLIKGPEISATTLKTYCYMNMFYGCTGITQGPTILPSLTIPQEAYEYMFYGCTALTSIPSLPATNVEYGGYQYMFQNCTNLVTGPSSLPMTTVGYSACRFMFDSCSKLVTIPSILPAATVGSNGYQAMFENCTSIVTAPNLPATTVNDYGYNRMFNGCTSLKYSPAILPATIVGASAYSWMFHSCSNLETVPSEISVLTSPANCCSQMFNNCKKITETPILKATTLSSQSYHLMFAECTNLTRVTALFTTTPIVGDSSDYGYTYAWLSSVASKGEFIKSKSATWSLSSTSGIPSGWTITYQPDNDEILFTTNDEDVDPSASSSFVNDYVDYVEYPSTINKPYGIIHLTQTITDLPDQAFYSTSSITSITLPNTITIIGNEAFAASPNLTHVTLGANTASIGFTAFASAGGSATEFDMYIPNSAECLSTGTFAGSGITHLTIGNGTEVIPDYICNNCDKLDYVNISDMTTFVGENAFSDCENLYAINYRGTTSQWSNVNIADDFAWAQTEDKAFDVNTKDGMVPYGSNCCFEAGSQVLTSIDGTTQSIETLRAGDKVISYNIETQQNYEAEVVNLIINYFVTHIAQITLENGNVVTMNEYHPILTRDGWHSLTNYNNYATLVVGDEVKVIDGYSKITNIEQHISETNVTMYNLNVHDINEDPDVDTNDNFYVNGMCAHNNCG